MRPGPAAAPFAGAIDGGAVGDPCDMIGRCGGGERLLHRGGERIDTTDSGQAVAGVEGDHHGRQVDMPGVGGARDRRENGAVGGDVNAAGASRPRVSG